jgi:hypothetical protein
MRLGATGAAGGGSAAASRARLAGGLSIMAGTIGASHAAAQRTET